MPDFTPPPPSKPDFSGLDPIRMADPWQVPEIKEPGEVEKKPLQYFERSEEQFGMPKFKFEKAFNEVKDILNEKIPLDWVDTLKDPVSNTSIDLKWTIDWDFMGAKIGPHTIDLVHYIDDFATWDIARIIRFLFVFIIAVMTIKAFMELILSAAHA